jgi:WD40 repeat protein
LVASFVRGRVITYRTSDQQVIAQIGPDTLQAVAPAVSPDGGLVATDYPVQVWQVGQAAPLFTLPGKRGAPVFSPDGKQLLVINQGLAELWDIVSGQMVREAGPADTAVFADGGSQIVTHTHRDKTIRLVGAGTPAPDLEIPLDEAAAHQLSPLGTMVVGYAPSSPGGAGGGMGVSLQAYHLPDGHPLWTVPADQAASSLAFSPDGRQIVAYSPAADPDAPTPRAFDTSTGAEISLPGVGWHPGLIRIALGPVGGTPILATGGGIFGLTGDPQDPLATPDSTYPSPGGSGFPIASVAISGDGQWLATGAMDGEQSTIVWNFPGRKVQRTLPAGYRTSTVTFTADSRDVVRVWDEVDAFSIATGEQAWQSLPSPSVPEAGGLRWFGAVSPAGDRMATNFGTGVTIFSTTDPNATTQLNVGQTYAALAFSPDGQTLATSGPMLWRVSDGQRLWPSDRLPTSPAPATSGDAELVDNWVTFSPDGTLILVSRFSSDGVNWLNDFQSYQTVTRIYRASDGALVRDMGTSLRRRPAFSADGAWIVAGSVVYPRLSGAPVQLSPASVFDSVSAFAPDGTIAVGGTDGVTRLFCPQ